MARCAGIDDLSRNHPPRAKWVRLCKAFAPSLWANNKLVALHWDLVYTHILLKQGACALPFWRAKVNWHGVRSSEREHAYRLSRWLAATTISHIIESQIEDRASKKLCLY